MGLQRSGAYTETKGMCDMRLIDREKLLETLDSYELTKWYHGDLITIIFDAPTVEAELVVYCKDCVSHRGLDEEESRILSRILKNNYCYCNRINKYMPECGFCSMGKRKEVQ